MGILDWMAAGYLAKRGSNKFNPPQVTVPSGLEMRALKAKGMNEYTIVYSKKGSGSTSQFTISRNTISMSGGWKFHWPENY